MAAKILVSLSARKACFALYERGGLSGFTTYDNDEHALRAFGELVARHTDAPVYLMVDTVEEEYRTELLQHVWGGARREMSQRMARQRLIHVYRRSLILSFYFGHGTGFHK